MTRVPLDRMEKSGLDKFLLKVHVTRTSSASMVVVEQGLCAISGTIDLKLV